MAEDKSKLLEPDPNKVVDIPIKQLLLDPRNPRLAWRDGNYTHENLIKLLWTEMAVIEVALSIAENGFFRSEPLFVIRAKPDEKDEKKQKYVVVEGNRRLAAVLLLRDEELRRKIKATDLPSIAAEKRAGLDKLPVIIYPDRESLWTSLGFRHINGIKPWDSFSKAKYVAEVHENYNIPLAEIARKIGDYHSTVKRLYRGYKLLEQAETRAGFAREDTVRSRFYFSHLYTAADQKEFQEFLGIDPESSLKPDPVPESKLGELAELMVWLYGKKSDRIEPIVRTQNPDLNTLRQVIGKPDALAALRSGNSLEVSHTVAIGDKRRFREALTNAKVELQNAKATVTTGYYGEEDLSDTIRDIIRLARSIENEMENKINEVEVERKKPPRRRRD